MESVTACEPPALKLKAAGLAEIVTFEGGGAPPMAMVTAIVRAGVPLAGVIITVPL